MNESWGVPRLATDPAQIEHLLAMYHLTRSLDGSRLVVSNDGWEHAVTDLCTIHDYGAADALKRHHATPQSSVSSEPAKRPIYAPGFRYRGEPILITEFGGIAFESNGEGWGYSTVGSAEKFLERYCALVAALLESEAVAGFCYTQLTDIEQEINGLQTFLLARGDKEDVDALGDHVLDVRNLLGRIGLGIGNKELNPVFFGRVSHRLGLCDPPRVVVLRLSEPERGRLEIHVRRLDVAVVRVGRHLPILLGFRVRLRRGSVDQISRGRCARHCEQHQGHDGQ
jgi:hypothetical protein